ncbi:MAG: tetratricopeptide repeat protein, partial [Flavobacteriales bacterium]|nr:tetratricopeptide repeat protein [Flavobacteriales bacterium]
MKVKLEVPSHRKINRGYYFTAVILVVLCYSSCETDVPETEEESQSPITTELSVLGAINEKIKLSHNDPELYYKKAVVELEGSNLALSLDDINRALLLDSTSDKYLNFKSDILYYQGDIKVASGFIEAWLRQSPNNKSALMKQAKLFLLTSDFQASVDVLDRVLKVDPFNPQVYFYKGMSHKGLLDSVSAIDAFQKSIALDQTYIKSHNQLGYLFSARDDKLAIRYFNQTLASDNKNIDALYGKAFFYQNRGEVESSRRLYKEILDLNPEHIDALYNMGYLNLVDFDNLDLAIEFFTKVLKL